MKKLMALFVLASLLTGASFAQIMVGASGDLHMDTTLTSDQIIAQFKSGEGIFYGGFAEIALGNVGIGAAGTFSFYTNVLEQAKMVYDVDVYLSYHLWGAKAFLDPFGELGVGYIADDYVSSADEMYDVAAYNPISASLFWYGAVGAGVNLGPVGVFAKLAYNSIILQQLPELDANGNETGNKIPYYGFADTTGAITPYVPAMRVTIGAKFIL